MTAIAVVALGVTALSVNSCKNKETEILVTGVKVSTPTLTINEGETATISFTVEPSNASNKGVSFTSSDTNVVTVDENGVVTAVGPGTATITITTKDGSYTATVTVTVKGKSVAVSGVSLDIVEVTIKEGDSVTLTATVKPDDAADKSVSWSSSDEAVASVADGVVTGVKAGSATITVKTNDGGKTATCAVTVEAKAVAVESVSLDKSELSLVVGEEATLTATVKPDEATDKEVSWSSSDPSVATVDEGGKVVAKAAGTTAVTVTTKDGAKSASCAVTVKAKTVAVESVSLDKSELTLVVGEDATLTATVKPDGASDKSVSWASDKEEVATVDEGGKVSAKAEGEATITVTTKDGGKTATCKVTVKAAEVKVTGIKLDKSSITIGVGEEYTLTPTIEPDDATDKTVTWQSNDASVAAVDETGKVTGKAAGSATIIATTKDGGFKATCSVKVTDAGVSVTGVSLNESEIVMEVGDGAKLWETVTPSTAANKKVTWSSDKPEVADVDDNGNVEAKAVGEAVITVTTQDGGFTATCKVTVVGKVIPVTSVSLDKTTITLTEGGSATLTATVKPDDASNKQVTWESDKVAVATVDENGKVTAVKAGTAVITVTTKDGGKTAKCTVTVKAATVAVTGVSLDKSSINMEVGEKVVLNATVAPSTATNKEVTWSSDKTSIATVDANGMVEAKAAGSATITVTTKDGGKKATCSVTVTAPSIELRTQFLEDKTTVATFGSVIHYKNGTNHRGTANEFLIVPWDSSKNNYVQDADASHFSCSSSKSDNVSVQVEDLGSRKAFCIKVLKNPTGAADAFSDLSFTYTSAGGTKFTKNTRVVIANSSAKSAFDYKIIAYYSKGSESYPDISGGTFTHVMNKAGETYLLRTYIGFDATSNNPTVCDTKDMAKFEFSNSNSSVLTMAQNIQDATYGSYPRAEYTFKGVGTSTIGIKYIDYKGNKLDKTIAVTVKKSYFDTGDYFVKDNSSSNPKYLPTDVGDNMMLYNSSGTSYKSNEIEGFTVTSSDPSVATGSFTAPYLTVIPHKPGYVTITVTGTDGSTRKLYYRIYKDVTAITGNSTTFKLGKGNEHHLEVGSGEDISFTPADATFTTTYDLEFKSSNTSVTTIDNNAWVKGVGVGTATVSAKPLHSMKITSFKDIRTFQVYDHSLQIIHRNPDNVTQNPDFYNTYYYKPIPESTTLQMVLGDKINFGFYYTQTSDNRITLTNQSDFTTTETSGIVNIEAKGDKIYQQVTALKTGTTKVAFVLMGDDGFFARTVNINVIPNRSLPTGSYVSIMASYTSNSSSAPRTLAVGQSENLYIYNSSGTQLTGDAISWKSSDTSIASVDPTTGSTTKVKGLKAGNVTITATDSFGKTFSFYYKVYNAVTSMTGKGTLLMGTNSQYTMAYNQDYTVSPSNATFTAASYFNWRSSNTNYATVESGGVVSTKNCGVANISAQPQHQYALSTYTTVRSITVAWWEAKCVSSNCTSSSAMKVGSTATPTTVITIDKGKAVCLQFEYRTDSSSPWTVLNSASYVASDYDSSILKNVTGLEITGSGKALQIGGNNTGTTKITITYKTSDQFFSNTFNVKVI
ncbi:MAG: Ig domain-containing protein [Bacteroidales bacterium]|nr:Ig domain-containing protein [Bacteroidales bacterium]